MPRLAFGEEPSSMTIAHHWRDIGTALVNPRLRVFRRAWSLAVVIGTLTLGGVLGITAYLLDQCDEVCGLTPVGYVKDDMRCEPATKEFDLPPYIPGAWFDDISRSNSDLLLGSRMAKQGVYLVNATFQPGFKGMNLSTIDSWHVPLIRDDSALSWEFEASKNLLVTEDFSSVHEQHLHSKKADCSSEAIRDSLAVFFAGSYYYNDRRDRDYNNQTDDVFISFRLPSDSDCPPSLLLPTSKYHDLYRWVLTPDQDTPDRDGHQSKFEVELHTEPTLKRVVLPTNETSAGGGAAVSAPTTSTDACGLLFNASRVGEDLLEPLVPLSFFNDKDLAACTNTNQVLLWLEAKLNEDQGNAIVETVVKWIAQQLHNNLGISTVKHSLAACIYRRDEYEVCVNFKQDDLNSAWDPVSQAHTGSTWCNYFEETTHYDQMRITERFRAKPAGGTFQVDDEGLEKLWNWNWTEYPTKTTEEPRSLGDMLRQLKFVIESARMQQHFRNLESTDWTVYCCRDICPSTFEALGSAFGYATYFEIFITFFVLLIYVSIKGSKARIDGGEVSVNMIKSVALEEDEDYRPKGLRGDSAKRSAHADIPARVIHI